MGMGVVCVRSLLLVRVWCGRGRSLLLVRLWVCCGMCKKYIIGKGMRMGVVSIAVYTW